MSISDSHFLVEKTPVSSIVTRTKNSVNSKSLRSILGNEDFKSVVVYFYLLKQVRDKASTSDEVKNEKLDLLQK